MGKAVRAIIIKDNKLLAMHRNKEGSQYYTLVGGRVNDGETLEQALKREVKEETGLEVTAARLVFTEDYPEPYNSQFIYLCEVAGADQVALTAGSEEEQLNRLGYNVHTPVWLEMGSFERVHFRTPQLQRALADSLRKGFPENPKAL